MLRRLVMVLLGLVLLASGIGLALSTSAGIMGLVVGLVLALVGLVCALAGTLPAPPATPTEPPEPVEVPLSNRLARIQERHAQELDGIPVRDRRGELIEAWRQHLDQHAPPLSQAIVEHPEREHLVGVQVEHLLEAYLAGFLAGRGWLEEGLEEKVVAHLGRSLMADFREAGLPLERLQEDLQEVVEGTLLTLVQMGHEDGKE
jgi:hypothetical protein